MGRNVAIGNFALTTQSYNSGGSWNSDNVAVGYRALNANQPTSTGNGIANTAVGNFSLLENTTGYNNTAIGFNALSSNLTAFDNSALGISALSSNTTANQNVAIGNYALYDQSYSPGYGWSSGNVAVGVYALTHNQPTSTTNGVSNTAVGNYALTTNTTGWDNTALGSSALNSNTTGGENTAVGRQALFSNTVGLDNTATGFKALRSNTTGNYNTAVGLQALWNNTVGYDNTAIGVNAAFTNIEGYHNTVIGRNANTAFSNLANATVIGAYATVTAINKVRIGAANVGVIEGQVAYTWPSDGRFKENVIDDIQGLDFIMKLEPVSFNFNRLKFAEHIREVITPDRANTMIEQSKIRTVGFIAQDVEKVIQEAGFTAFDAVHAPTNEADNYGIAYAEFVVPLVKAVQELSNQNDSQNLIIENLQSQNELLTQRLEKLESILEANNHEPSKL